MGQAPPRRRPAQALLLSSPQGEVACQHGEEECLGNNVILCAQKARPEQVRVGGLSAAAAKDGCLAAGCSAGLFTADTHWAGRAARPGCLRQRRPLPTVIAAGCPPLCLQDAWFPFVRCLAEPLTGNLTATDRASYIAETSPLLEEAMPRCATEHGFDIDSLLECAQGEVQALALPGLPQCCWPLCAACSLHHCRLHAAGAEGAALEAQAAAATAALQPSHTGVPWVTAAGQSLGGNTPTLAATGLFVCAAAPADARPPACEQLALDVNM